MNNLIGKRPLLSNQMGGVPGALLAAYICAKKIK